MSDLTMSDLTMVANDHDFTPLHAAMQRYVDQEILAGVSTAVLSGRDLVDVHYTGFSDREAAVPLVEGHIFRAYSNTKLMVSCAALLALEDGHFKMDDPIETYIPALGNRQVLRQGATDITDTEPAASSITIRHLLSHSSGLSNGFLEPDSLITQTYTAHKVNDPDTTLAQMMDILGELPLTFHPGKAWGYSVALDVIGRLVEIVSGETLDEFLQKRIFDPLGMVDTGFFCAARKAGPAGGVLCRRRPDGTHEGRFDPRQCDPVGYQSPEKISAPVRRRRVGHDLA